MFVFCPFFIAEQRVCFFRLFCTFLILGGTSPLLVLDAAGRPSPSEFSGALWFTLRSHVETACVATLWSVDVLRFKTVLDPQAFLSCVFRPAQTPFRLFLCISLPLFFVFFLPGYLFFGKLLRRLLAQEAGADAGAVFQQRAHQPRRGLAHRLRLPALPKIGEQAAPRQGGRHHLRRGGDREGDESSLVTHQFVFFI